jgi:CHAT domain-containing protein
LYFDQLQWSQARASYTTAIEATETLYKAAATEVSRQAELAAAGELYSRLAFCLAHLGHLDEAVEQLEVGKARGLAEALARDRAVLDDVRREDQAVFEAARSRVKSLQVEARSIGREPGFDLTTSRSFVEISDDLHAAHDELDAVINRIRTYRPEFIEKALYFDYIAASGIPECPLVYLITTTQGSLALIVPAGAETLESEQAVWLSEFRSGDLESLLVEQNADGEVVGGLLFGQVEGRVDQVQAGLDRALPILRDRLMGPLASRLLEHGYQRAALIPGGRLSLLPLHAACFDAVRLTYTPSSRSLRATRGVTRDRAQLAPLLFGIGNPLPNPRPLAFARSEVDEIAHRFAPESQHLLFEHAATKGVVAESLPSATHLHFACHGTFDVEEPLDSALSLSNDETLTLRDLLDGGLDLSAARLAILSACQTGIVDFRKVPDEAIGFPAGFIQAGVPSVISSLWTVNDLSTAILMSRFYLEHLDNGLDPASALHRAQDWLRTATARDMKLSQLYEQRYQESDKNDPHAFRATRYFRANPEVRPFAHPYYWAAFTFTGAA